jgi:hypothetical protein
MKLKKDTKMFNKTLIATAILAASGTVSAVTLSLDPDLATLSTNSSGNPGPAVAPRHTIEGLFGATTMEAAAYGLTLETNLTVGDKLTVTYTQPFAVGATAAASLLAIMPHQGTNDDTMVLSRDGASAVAGLNSLTYTVTNIGYDTGAAEDNDSIGAVIYTDRALAFAPCTVPCVVKSNASVSRAGAVIDAAATAGLSIASAVKQYTVAATTPFDGIVDVNALRKDFTTGDKTDAAVLTLTEVAKADGANIGYGVVGANNVVAASTITGAGATKGKGTVSLTGSFGFLDMDAATAGVQLTATGVTAANVFAATNFADTGSSITDSVATFVDLNSADTTFGVSLESNNKAVIPVQTIASSWDIAYSSASSDASSSTTAKALGGFTMNGASTSFYAVPYGPKVSQMLWVANEGTAEGNLTATAFDSLGNSYPATGEYNLGQITAKTHKSLAADLLAKLRADGLDDTISQRLQIAVTATIPAANVNFYGAYKVGDYRISLFTSAERDRL